MYSIGAEKLYIALWNFLAPKYRYLLQKSHITQTRVNVCEGDSQCQVLSLLPHDADSALFGQDGRVLVTDLLIKQHVGVPVPPPHIRVRVSYTHKHTQTKHLNIHESSRFLEFLNKVAELSDSGFWSRVQRFCVLCLKRIFEFSIQIYFVTERWCVSLTLVVNFGTVLSTKALVLQSFIVHVKLLHHVVIELVPTSSGATTEKIWGTGKMSD